MKLPHDRRKFPLWPAMAVSPAASATGSDAWSRAVRLATLVFAVISLAACWLAGCSDNSPVAPSGATESAAAVEKNCNDPRWREQNLGLWYSVCRQPLRW